MTAQTDRLVGLTGNLGMKAPCRVATTANITLSGLQTVDGITVVEGDRVLVKNQTTGSENGVYNASSGTWTRAADWDGTGDVLQGSSVVSASGTANAQRVWQLTTTDPVVGTSTLTFISLVDAANISNTPAGGIAATTVQAAINELDTEKAPLASPVFTGNPTAPTPAASDNDTSIATTAFVQTELTTKQPLDATLSSISGLGTAADKMMYSTAVDTWAETPITAAGRALIDDADAATQRATLGLGNVQETYIGGVSSTGVGSGLPTGWTTSRTAVGTSVITHNKNNTNVIAVFSAPSASASAINFSFSQTANDITVLAYLNGVLTDLSFYFIIRLY